MVFGLGGLPSSICEILHIKLTLFRYFVIIHSKCFHAQNMQNALYSYLLENVCLCPQ